MTLTEAQTQFNALADRLSAAKAAQKAALATLGRTPTDVWDTYPDELRAVTGGTGNYQESKTVTADPAGKTILPDEGYSGMLKAIIAAEPNFQPWNLVDGIEAWGITGTAKPAVSTAPPTNLPVDKDDADTAYEGQTGAAPTETDYFVCVDNDGNITYWYLSDDFTITSYDPITTEFKTTGAIRMAYHTTGESAGTWTLDDFTSAESGGWNYLKNIRSCTRDALYYGEYEVYPDSAWDTADNWSYNGTVLPKLPSWDKSAYPYAYIDKLLNYTLVLSSAPLYVDNTESNTLTGSLHSDGAEVNFMIWSCATGGSSWNLANEGAGVIDRVNTVVWANTNLYYLNSVNDIDGTLYLAASDPVPVYE